MLTASLVALTRSLPTPQVRRLLQQEPVSAVDGRLPAISPSKVGDRLPGDARQVAAPDMSFFWLNFEALR